MYMLILKQTFRWMYSIIGLDLCMRKTEIPTITIVYITVTILELQNSVSRLSRKQIEFKQSFWNQLVKSIVWIGF